MAVQGVAGNSHLYSTGIGFTNTADAFSISVWINANWTGNTGALSMVGIYDGTPVSTGTPTTGAGLQIGTRAGLGDLVCWSYGGGILTTTANNIMNAYTNIWCLITYTWDGTTHSIYRNDTLLATSTNAIVPVTLTQVYLNGYPPGSSNETSTTQVDSYLYYNRVLSPAEIQTIYNTGGARHGIEYGLIARYEFDESAQGASVSTVIDVSGNGNNLLIAGAGFTYTYTGGYANANIRTVH